MAKVNLEIVVDDCDEDLLQETNLRMSNILADKIAKRFLGVKPAGYHLDHVDDDWKNNRRNNLRYITAEENYRKSNPNPTGYVGVYVLKDGTIIGRIQVKKHKIHLGTFDTVEDAAIAYDNYVKKHQLGRTLNFGG